MEEHRKEKEEDPTENRCIGSLDEMSGDINGTSEDCVENTFDYNRKNIEEKMRDDGFGDEEVNIARMMREELLKNELEHLINLQLIDRKS